VRQQTYSILVVDDDPPILELLGEYLSTRGHDCKMASNTTQALDLLERERFDVLITDLKMPGGGGLKLLQTIREKDLSIAIIMMTGYGTIESALQVMKHGAHDYLLKPFKLRDVHASMEEAISKQLAERNTVRLKHIIQLQDAADKAQELDELEPLYDSLANYSKSELGGTGAIVAFFESDRGVWQEYYRTADSPLARIDIQSIGDSLNDGQIYDQDRAWFSSPRPLAVVPIIAKTRLNSKPGLVGLIAVTNPSSSHQNPEKVLKIYASIVGAAVSLCLIKAGDKTDNTSANFDQEKSDSHDNLIEAVVSELGLTPDDCATAKCALKMSVRPNTTLRERYNGAPMDVMTIGGGGLPFQVLSRLEPLLLASSERHDGQGSPSGLTSDEIDQTAQVVHILSIFQTITSNRGFAHRMNQTEAMEEIHKKYSGVVSPKVLAAFSNAVAKTTQG